MSKLWGGRFAKPTDHEVEVFTASIGVDQRLWEVDIRASVAHARMLGAQGVLTNEECSQLLAGLEQVRAAIASGDLSFSPAAEDVHSEIEKHLRERIGSVAGKLHTARSRNDQVATDTRLYLQAEIIGLDTELLALQEWLLETAESHLETILPGLTHLQHAQPVSLAHHLLAYFWMFQRDRERLSQCRERVASLPLGSAALAGTSFPLDREKVSRELGFASIAENSLDAVSDRDFVIEFLADASMVMMHLSRLSEELILWSMPEFAFVTLDDSVTTGSSIMPQKKNPDVAELIRGRVGRVYGALMGACTMMKALPLSYNRDLQEDKTFLFEGLDVVKSCTRLMRLMLVSAQFHPEKMHQALRGDFSNATDLADYLVRKGLAFREAHEVTGLVVRHCLEAGRALEDLQLADLQPFSPLFAADVLPELKHEQVMKARTSQGGTGPTAVRRQMERARQVLQGR